MTPLSRLAFIGNSLPRRCGIATFTTDLQQAIAVARPALETAIVAMTDSGHEYDYPAAVRVQVRDDRIEDYVRAAATLNAGGYEAVSLQHEFGIFGGEAGSHVMALLAPLTMPIVSTLHTVLPEPEPMQRAVLERVIGVSAKVVVMAEKARELLRGVYGVPAEKIELIPHGIPDFAFLEPDLAKAEFGFAGRSVILTFGLLSPNKGIEVVIDAMPAILESRADAVYVVLGATHPNLVRDQGEAYRESLVARARALGIGDHVVFLDQFVDQATLLRYISMCDIYVTPYLDEAQMTSGTLAYSFGLGKPVVSTPYWHARDLLADGRGILVPFGDSAATGREIAALLTDDVRRKAMGSRAYQLGRSMTWTRSAERYLGIIDGARHGGRPQRSAPPQARPQTDAHPPMRLCHFLSMCDDVGIFQHAIHSVPDRAHGYCIDDNARALLLACALNGPGEQRLPELLISRLAAFVQHAWNPDTKRFRNFMGFNRTWLEESGSEDSHARAVWALGVCARDDASPTRREWAAGLFAEALASTERFRSPRSWAFTLLGLDSYCAAVPNNSHAVLVRQVLAERLMAILAAVETPDWAWFENGLAYDNARLPQALIVTGVAAGKPSQITAGLRSLRWLMRQQTAPAGYFRPVGTAGFGDLRKPPMPFDQQPLEAAATISACLAAWRAGGEAVWTDHAERAFAWFAGGNSLALSLIDAETGGCRDGLHPDRANSNQGGESVISYLLGHAEIRRLARDGGDQTHPVLLRVV